jgi:hypothetical protein
MLLINLIILLSYKLAGATSAGYVEFKARTTIAFLYIITQIDTMYDGNEQVGEQIK